MRQHRLQVKMIYSQAVVCLEQALV